MIKEIKQFNYKGYKCIVREISRMSGLASWFDDSCGFDLWYCGYVCIPATHKLFKVPYQDLDIDCHGGLTYSEKEGKDWVIGFDCAHCGDTPILQNEDYVINECKKIVDQLEVIKEQ